MPRDSAATRARILAAAIEEFSAHGLAGGRVDRIAEAAEANKRSLYVHFGDKEGLFLAALEAALGALVAAVPLTEHDLPGYAARMFDYLAEHPETMRLAQWRVLERPEAGPDERGIYAEKVEGIRRSVPDGAEGFLPPTDLIVFVTNLAAAWFNSPQELLLSDGSDPADPGRRAQHRAALVEAVSRLVAPSSER